MFFQHCHSTIHLENRLPENPLPQILETSRAVGDLENSIVKLCVRSPYRATAPRWLLSQLDLPRPQIEEKRRNSHASAGDSPPQGRVNPRVVKKPRSKFPAKKRHHLNQGT